MEHTFSVEGVPIAIALSPSGKFFASVVEASAESEIRIWSTSSGERVQTIKVENYHVFNLLFSKDENMLIAEQLNNRIKIWSLTTGDLIRTLSTDYDERFAISFTSNGKAFISTGWVRLNDKRVNAAKIWDASSGKQLLDLENIKYVELSSVENTLITGEEYDVSRCCSINFCLLLCIFNCCLHYCVSISHYLFLTFIILPFFGI